ncbi:MAG: DUF2652 domain-containing protein [Armatimonadota bacterium]|nr:DUF2652 domain-containing protein [Armatimonadota bacterium]MDR7494766.1 DUF2652 domain-containing protein [Armatimonadota bacterium]MDR7499591.1 DUF2652 domain-containing protein [Armatimonadota bacterium]MDR7505295.1 DUF2652 domain-containing protein [Armatimonadota bacterium]MDR7547658.1 DUF2652 domain-containing protein [Armatimonadota bacterium]
MERVLPTAMGDVQQGCLVIADITGYTRYLAGVELEHSQDVLADLMNVLVAQMRGLLHLAKLEGDAVFCYEHEGEADGGTLMAMIESCYFAFSRRVQTIDRLTTCRCNACRLIPTLDLKFLVHHGQFVIQEVAGSRELMGRDVILVHRLLKNTYTERTGIRGYAMATEPSLRHFGIDPAALGAVEHHETYHDIGEVHLYVLNLNERWRQAQAERAVYIAPGEGLTLAELDLPAPPPLVWHFVTSPRRRALWQPDVVRVEESARGGVRGAGTVNHCVHGDHTVEEEILDWKPVRYLTDRSKTSLGVVMMTTELTPVGPSGTHLSIRAIPEGGPEALETVRGMLPEFRQMFAAAGATLLRLLREVSVEAEERAGG